MSTSMALGQYSECMPPFSDSKLHGARPDYAGTCSHQGVNNLSHASSMTMRVALPSGSIRCTVKRVCRSPVRLSLCTCGLRLASHVLLAPVRDLMRTGLGRA